MRKLFAALMLAVALTWTATEPQAPPQEPSPAETRPAETEFLYRVRPARTAMLTAPTELESAAVARHFRYLTDLLAAGVVVLAGRTTTTDNSSFGIIVFRAASEEKARAIMLADPAVAEGVFVAELFPFRVALIEGRK